MSMRMRSRWRTTFVFAAVGTALAGVFTTSDRAVPKADALANYEVETIYYTDSSKEVECGYTLFHCYGGVVRSGCRTAFGDRTFTPCD